MERYGVRGDWGLSARSLEHNSPIDVMDRAIRQGELPSYCELQQVLSQYENYGGETRTKYALKYGYGVPCREVIHAVAQYGPLLEVGAGNGFWSFWLRSKGCDVIATDPKEAGMFNQKNHINDLVQIEAVEALQRFPNRNVLIVWPYYTSTWPTDIVQRMKVGQILCYVGEGPLGCCAPPSFFSALNQHGVELIYMHRSPAWHMVIDYLAIYRKQDL